METRAFQADSAPWMPILPWDRIPWKLLYCSKQQDHGSGQVGLRVSCETAHQGDAEDGEMTRIALKFVFWFGVGLCLGMIMGCGDDGPLIDDGIYRVTMTLQSNELPSMYSVDSEAKEVWEIYSNDQGYCFRLPNEEVNGGCSKEQNGSLTFSSENVWNEECGGIIETAINIKPNRYGFAGDAWWRGTLSCNPDSDFRGPFTVRWNVVGKQTHVEFVR